MYFGVSLSGSITPSNCFILRDLLPSPGRSSSVIGTQSCCATNRTGQSISMASVAFISEALELLYEQHTQMLYVQFCLIECL